MNTEFEDKNSQEIDRNFGNHLKYYNPVCIVNIDKSIYIYQ